MSEVARWSYTNTATVKPLTGYADWDGQPTYGTPYTIACTWEAATEMVRDTGAHGAEFVARHVIYTEDKRPKYLDLIMLGTEAVDGGQDGVVMSPDLVGDEPGRDWEEIRSITSWDMSPFGEPDSPDFRLATK